MFVAGVVRYVSVLGILPLSPPSSSLMSLLPLGNATKHATPILDHLIAADQRIVLKLTQITHVINAMPSNDKGQEHVLHPGQIFD